MKKPRYKNLQEFAYLCYVMLKNDYSVVIGVGGYDTGVGKSCFLWNLNLQYEKVSGMKFNPDNVVFTKKALSLRIDGVNPKQGDIRGRLPEYSSIMADELFKLMYRRNWHNKEQIKLIETLNTCRDRHLLLGGAIPNFWDLDGAFNRRVGFYIYIFERGKAWVFEKENNPFSSDPWNQKKNFIMFRRYKNPFKMPNYVTSIGFPDFTAEHKSLYYAIRNEGRLED